jgi:phytoene synthase
VRDPNTLARACDLGVAMQLTNIARDVGEDAREGRLYLPTDWMAEAGVTPEAFLRDPAPTPQIRAMVRRLLREADDRYAWCDAGIAQLPLSCRPGIFAARHIYGGINRVMRAGDHDTITQRARTSRSQKLGWVMLAFLRGAGTAVMPRSPMLYARPLPETAFLVEAAGDPHAGASDWSDTLYRTMAQLKTQDRMDSVSLLRSPPRARTSA